MGKSFLNIYNPPNHSLDRVDVFQHTVIQNVCFTILGFLIHCLIYLGPVYAQAPPMEEDYSLSELRCPLGDFREGEVCAPFSELETQILNRGGTIYWVDSDFGDDTNDGSMSAPWQTISKAAESGVMSPGDAVFIRGGVYHESIRPQEGGTADLPIIFAAYNQEAVTISGKRRVTTSWRKVRNTDIWVTNWNDPAFDFPYIRFPGDPDGAGSNLFYEVSPAETIYDDARRRDVIIVNREMYRPFYPDPSGPTPHDHLLTGSELSVAGMPEGTFYLHEGERRKRMYVRLIDGMNPNYAEMHTSSASHLFNPSDDDFNCANPYAETRDYIHLVGLTFEHVANVPQQGAVCTGQVGSEFNNVTVQEVNGAGFLIVGDQHVITDVGAYDNGMSGIRGGNGPEAGCTNCILQYSESLRNNRKGFDPFWESGGGKWQYTSYSIFRHLNFSGNYGPGLWLDINNQYNIVENSRFHGNFGVNVFIEFQSEYNLIYNNVSTHAYTNVIEVSTEIANHDYEKWQLVLKLNEEIPEDFFGFGIQIHAASYNQVLYNTMVSNDGGGLRIRYDDRDPTIHNIFFNNISMNFLDHNFYTDSRHRGHEVALQNFAFVDKASLQTNEGDGNAYKSHHMDGVPLTYFASFLYRLFDGAEVIQARTNNIIEWRDSTMTDPLSFMVDENAPSLVDPSDWRYGWCYAPESQFHYRAKPMPAEVDELLEELPGDHGPIDHVDIGSQMTCSWTALPQANKTSQVELKLIASEWQTGLSQNYPNPFNSSTDITYTLDRAMHVRVTVYDLLGREVLQLVDGKRERGVYTVSVEGSALPTGVYMYSLETPGERFVRKMTVR